MLKVMKNLHFCRYSKNRAKKIWIDLENTPHVLFFNPIIKELKNRGYQVVVTARDFSQVFQLADFFGLDYKKLGKHYGKTIFLKVFGILMRSARLIAFIKKEKPVLALSHGSRSQLISSKILSINSAAAIDYEFTFHTNLLNPNYLFVPKVLYNTINANIDNIFAYPGIKEDVYVPSFIPDANCLNEFNFNNDDVIVCIRPPATVAHYHQAKSDELFSEIMKRLSDTEKVRIIMLPRVESQSRNIKIKWFNLFHTNKIIIPSNTYNGLDLIWHSDLVISGGGTMIREAAALNVPAYSIFGGQIGAVDRFLEKDGRLTILHNNDEIKNKLKLAKHKKIFSKNSNKSYALNFIISKIDEIISDEAPEVRAYQAIEH